MFSRTLRYSLRRLSLVGLTVVLLPLLVVASDKKSSSSSSSSAPASSSASHPSSANTGGGGYHPGNAGGGGRPSSGSTASRGPTTGGTPPAPRTAPLQTVRQLATPELPLVVRPPTTITGARRWNNEPDSGEQGIYDGAASRVVCNEGASWSSRTHNSCETRRTSAGRSS